MKVKASYSIKCDKGDFNVGDIFEIDAKDLPMYGDAVKAVGEVPAAKAEPVKEEKPAKVEQAEQAEKEEPKAEKPKTSTTRRKVSK